MFEGLAQFGRQRFAAKRPAQPVQIVVAEIAKPVDLGDADAAGSPHHPLDVVAGADLAAEKRDFHHATAKTITGVITTVGAAGNAGVTRMLVLYVTPASTAATKV